MPEQMIPVVIIVGTLVVMMLGIVIIVARFYEKVDQGQVLIVNTMKDEPRVTFTGLVVYPIVNRAEVMDISVKTLPIHLHGKEAPLCKDDIRADIKVIFHMRVNKTTEDVLKVAQSIGCKRASDPRALEELFAAKFSEALHVVAGRFEFKTLTRERDHYRDEIIALIGVDLNGFVLDDAAVELVARTPIEELEA